jgi:hypothetical protein
MASEILIWKEALNRVSQLRQDLVQLSAGSLELGEAMLYEPTQEHFLEAARLLIKCKVSYIVLSNLSPLVDS